MNCKIATQRLSEQQDQPLPLSERLRLYFHLLSCIGCRHYRRQMNFLRTACQRFPR